MNSFEGFINSFHLNKSEASRTSQEAFDRKKASFWGSSQTLCYFLGNILLRGEKNKIPFGLFPHSLWSLALCLTQIAVLLINIMRERINRLIFYVYVKPNMYVNINICVLIFAV